MAASARAETAAGGLVPVLTATERTEFVSRDFLRETSVYLRRT